MLAALSTLCFVRLALEMREGALDASDVFAEQFVDAWRGHLDKPMLAATALGDVAPMSAVTVIVVAALLRRRRALEARYLLLSAGGGLLLNLGLKLLFHRPRPAAALVYMLAQPHSFSFPSGHTMGSMSVLASLAVVLSVLRPSPLYRTAGALITVCFVGAVAVSRVYFGAHFPSDVLGGIFAAGAWVSLVTGWAYPRLLPGESDPKQL